MGKLTTERKMQLVTTLDGNLRRLELTKTQRGTLEKAYDNVAKWLASSDMPLLSNAQIRPQGSVRFGTTVRPVGKDEFDVDLLCILPDAHPYFHSANEIYKTVGDRLGQHGIYEKMLSPKNRCWRLDYADGTRFHMDITPAMPNPECTEDGVLVPDREHRVLKISNPVQLANIFDDISKLAPEFSRLGIMKFTEAMARASIEPLPEAMGANDLLRRTIQVAKRHRDILYQSRDGYPPISMIITTLIMRSYAQLTRGVFETPWDFIIEVVRDMPRYIVVNTFSTYEKEYFVSNPSAPEENFADKWNKDPNRAYEFYFWHGRFLADLEELARGEGLDQIQPVLRDKIIGADATDWYNNTVSVIGQKRSKSQLYRTPMMGGLTSTPGILVRENTFFGDD